MRHLPVISLILLMFFVSACSEDYLDKKPDKSLVVPSTLDDFQALLDFGDQVMNVTPALGFLGSTETFTAQQTWAAWAQATQRNAYIWAKDVYNGEPITDWNIPYQQVLYCNIVLDGLAGIKTTSNNQQQWSQIHAAALFYRARAYYELAQLFAVPYNASTAATDLGIPMRSSSDIKTAITRGTLEQTYQQIVKDFTAAADNLPETTPYTTRPSVQSAKAMLAKTYLAMGDYGKAGTFAGEVMDSGIKLMDYNEMDSTFFFTFQLFNPETIFFSNMTSYSSTFMRTTYIDTVLYSSYESNDLRKRLFFRKEGPNRYSFKGSYATYLGAFSGIAADEIFLLVAECKARSGELAGAKTALNTLLEKRFITGTFTPITETDPELLLRAILREREKELVMRNTRWSDLRRLNTDPRFAIILTRKLGDETYTLPPGDPRYTFAIPDAEIAISGIPQNQR